MKSLIVLLLVVDLLLGGFLLIDFVLMGIAKLWGYISNKSKKPTFDDKYNEWYAKEYLQYNNHDEYLRQKRAKESKNKK